MKTILIHGLGQDSSAWDRVSALLSSDNIEVPELSGLVGGGSYGELYRGFSDYCRGFSEPLCLCGLSLGAVLALNFAVDNPDKVSSLALIAPQFKMPKALLKLQSAIFRIMPESSFGSTGFSKKAFLRLTGSMAELDFTPMLGSVSCPAVIACGEKDKTNRKAARQLAVLLPDAEYVEIPGSGHETNADNPEGTAEIIAKAIKAI